MDDLTKDPASACFLCCLMPRRPPQVTRPSSRRNSVSLQDIDARNIDIYSQEARSPRLLFCWLLPMALMMLAGWRVVTRPRGIDPLRRNTNEPNPRLRG